MSKQKRQKQGFRQKGRSVKPKALEQVRSLLEGHSLQPDLLIEHLHKIQDKHGYISADHLMALAGEMKLAPVEVYEVATFYHHFDVVKEGQQPPPELTVRVCESITCELFGAHDLIASLSEGLGDEVRVQKVPCVGRCQNAPVAMVGTHPVEEASLDKVKQAVASGLTDAVIPKTAIGYEHYCSGGGYTLLNACLEGQKSQQDVIGVMDDSGLRGLGGAGFPAGRKWRIVSGFPGKRILAVNID